MLPRMRAVLLLAAGLLLMLTSCAEAQTSGDTGIIKVSFQLQEELAGRVLGKLRHQQSFRDAMGDQADKPHQYEFISTYNNYISYFKIDRESGELSVKSPINREMLCNLPKGKSCCPGSSENCEIKFVIKVENKAPEAAVKNRLLEVTVSIIDINDSPPEFKNPIFSFSLPENAAIGTKKNLPIAKDSDAKNNGILEYSLASCGGEPVNPTFQLDPMLFTNSGVERVKLVLHESLDREKKDAYKYCLLAVDKGKPQLTGTVKINIKVDDVNDHAPRWKQDQKFTVDVKEDINPYTQILQLQAIDEDKEFGHITYSLDPETTDAATIQTFEIRSDNGFLMNRKSLDYEIKKSYVIPVIARDNGGRTASATVTVNILDVNDMAPKIEYKQRTHVRLKENGKKVEHLTIVTVTDTDSGENGRVECSLEPNPAVTKKYFTLSNKISHDGKDFYELNTNHSFDREAYKQYHLKIICADNGKPKRTSFKDITVIIDDVNDHAPRFLTNPITLYFPEGQHTGKKIAKISTFDEDNGRNSLVDYFLDDPTKSIDFVRVQRTTGVITAGIEFDRETKDFYTFNITARDRGTPPKESKTVVNLYINDTNDNNPKFVQEYNFPVFENTSVGTIVGQLNATDPDLGRNGTIEFDLRDRDYRLPFSVHSNGEIRLNRRLDSETHSQYNLLVAAVDRGSPSRSSTTNLLIEVKDINDSPPRFSRPGKVNFRVSCENTALHHILKSDELVATDRDKAPNNEIKYNITNLYPRRKKSAHHFKIDNEGQIILTKVPEKCPAMNYQLTVTAYDPTKPAHKARKSVSITFLPGERIPSYNYGSDNGDNGYGNNAGNHGGEPLADNNMLIIIALICAAIIIAVVLIVTILLLRRKAHNEGYKKGTVITMETKDNCGVPPPSCPLPRKIVHPMDMTDIDNNMMEAAEIGMMPKVKAAASLDNLYFEHDTQKDYEKMKWATYQNGGKKHRLRSMSNDRGLSESNGQESQKPFQQQMSSDSRNTYQSLGNPDYARQVSIDNYMTSQPHQQPVNAWLGTTVRPRAERQPPAAVAVAAATTGRAIDSKRPDEEKSGHLKSSYFTISFV